MSELGANFQFRIEMSVRQKVAEVKVETEEKEVEEEKEGEGEEADHGTEEENSGSKVENNKQSQQQTEEEKNKKEAMNDITPVVAEPKVEEMKGQTVERMAGIASKGLPEEKEKESDERESLMRFSSARMYPPSDEEKSNYFDF
jgi:hypothetical protein